MLQTGQGATKRWNSVAAQLRNGAATATGVWREALAASRFYSAVGFSPESVVYVKMHIALLLPDLKLLTRRSRAMRK